MTQVKIINRYGDEFLFTLQEDGNILWEGKFEYVRIGYPNDYTEAYKKWHNDFPKTEMLSLEDFKNIVHTHNEETGEYTYLEYLKLIKSNTGKIDMVDPSGGPYIGVGENMGRFTPVFKGKIVKDIQNVSNGYLLIC